MLYFTTVRYVTLTIHGLRRFFPSNDLRFAKFRILYVHTPDRHQSLMWYCRHDNEVIERNYYRFVDVIAGKFTSSVVSVIQRLCRNVVICSKNDSAIAIADSPQCFASRFCMYTK